MKLQDKTPDADRKYAALVSCLRERGRLMVALSGGVDSTFLLAVARKTLGDNVCAVTVDAPYIPRREIGEAEALAGRLGVRHTTIRVPLSDEVAGNPEDRCYRCKRVVFSMIKEEASRQEIPSVAEGTHRDDRDDDRPGLKALGELGILSPLRTCGFSKNDIRGLSRELQLPTWDKPAYACLLTRIPYNVPVTIGELERIERSEEYLRGQGFAGARVRSHGGIARIEVAREERVRLLDEPLLDAIAVKVKEFGFTYVCVDAEGYRPGSMNERARDAS